MEKLELTQQYYFHKYTNEKKVGKLIFGPVNSRRLGRSLGIDVVPKKCCNLNCVYCEVGPTIIFGVERGDYTSWQDLKEEFLHALDSKEFDVVTVTGMGEPTLNRQLKHISHEIKNLPENVLEYLKRRPAALSEIAQGLNVPMEYVNDTLSELHHIKKIQKKTHEGQVVYYI